MTDADRYRLLFGPYRAPRWRYGRVVMDEARAEVTVVGLSAGRIPCPVGKRGRAKAPVLAADLARAVRGAAGVAVAHWWGLAPDTAAITGEPGGRHTDAAVLGPAVAVADADALLRQLGIAVTDEPPPVPQSRHTPPAVPTPVAERPRTVFTLDAAGRPHVIEVRVHVGPTGPRESFAVVDGTPVVQVARGHYRTAGSPPHVDLYAADADVRTAPAGGPPGWSGTDTAPLTVRKPVAVS